MPLSIPALGNTLPNTMQTVGTALGQMPDLMMQEQLKRQQTALQYMRPIVSAMMSNPALKKNPGLRQTLNNLSRYAGVPIPTMQAGEQNATVAEPTSPNPQDEAQEPSGKNPASGPPSAGPPSGITMHDNSGAYQADLQALRQQPALLRVPTFQQKLMTDAQSAGRNSNDVNADIRGLAGSAGASPHAGNAQPGNPTMSAQAAPGKPSATAGTSALATRESPQGSAPEIDVDALAAMVGLGSPPKSVADLSGADMQYYMSLPKGSPRLQAAQAAGLRGVTPQFVNAPMEPRSVGEVTEFSKELQQERTAVQSGNATPDEWVKFVADNTDRLSWVGMTPQQLMSDPQVLGELTQNAADKIQQLANSGIIAKSTVVRANAEMARARTAADVAQIMIKYTGAKIEALPQEVQAKVTQATAALIGAQAKAAEVQQQITNATQGTWFQHQDIGVMQQRMAISRKGITAYQSLLQSDSANLRSLNGIVEAQIRAGKDPTDVMVTVSDPKSGAPQQVKLGDALTMAQQRVTEDRQQLQTLSSKDFLTTPTPGGDTENPGRTYSSSKSGKKIYSDDGGQTWHYSQ